MIAEYDLNDNLLRRYFYGPGIDEPILIVDVADNNAVYYYHFDGLGSVVALSDNSGNIVERYSYDVFGEPNRVSDVNNPYMFTGRRFDTETGLYYYRARYYNPKIGRFLQTDPIGYEEGLNLYTYVWNNPVKYTDPLGLELTCMQTCELKYDLCTLVCDVELFWSWNPFVWIYCKIKCYADNWVCTAACCYSDKL